MAEPVRETTPPPAQEEPKTPPPKQSDLQAQLHVLNDVLQCSEGVAAVIGSIELVKNKLNESKSPVQSYAQIRDLDEKRT
eukprot:12561068-Alexandrium_andersonii.AAC.1